MGLLNKLLRVRTLVIAAIIAVICAAAYYITASGSWSSNNVFVHVKVDEFPDDHHPNNHDRDLLGGPPDNFDYNNNNNKAPNPLGADHKIDPDPPKRDGGSVKVDPPDAADPNNEHKLDKLPQEDNQVKTGSEMHIRFHGEDKNQGNRGVENDGTNPSDFINQLSEAGMTGMLNYDVWRWIVGYTVDDMRIDKSYPNFPDERKTINRLHVEFNEADPQDVKGKYSHRVFGYLIPPEPGDYQFSIEMSDVTAAGCVELWLSNNSDPLNLHKILVIDYDDMWKRPHSEEFIEFDFRSFALAAKSDKDGNFISGPSMEKIQGHLPSSELQAHRHIQFVGDTIYPITEIDVLPQCEFKPLYAGPRKVKKYDGVWQVFESKVYPNDETWFRMWHKKDTGNSVIGKETVDKVFSLYSKAFQASKKYKGDIIKIHYLEESRNSKVPTKKTRHPEVVGYRYLLELDIQLHEPEEKLIHTSEYVYLPKDSTELCHTSNFQWRKSPTVDVYFVVSLKNLGVWVDHLIHNMENIYAETKDEHFELVIVDYDSQDMNVEEKLKKSSVNRWHLVTKTGSFSRSGGLQAGIDYVTDPNSIVMTIDMHLTLPPGFVEYIRRHTIQGKMACTPFFFRLNKGYTEINFNGFWETLTYGLFSMFKSDWTQFGGFDLTHYKDKWGGEDWDVLDRSLARGYEMFRIRYPGLVHYYHTKAGMWGTNGAKGRPR